MQEWCSDDEGNDALDTMRVLPPGSHRSRRLMEARCQQCVICLADKEHTIVPPHRHESAQHVEGHRICTECWSQFLYHGLRQPGRDGRGPAPLTCPLCRGTIDVPDAWAAFMELPQSWQQPRTVVKEPMPCLPSCTPSSSSDRRVWCQRSRSDSSGSDSDGSVVEAKAAYEVGSAPLGGGWRVLRCLMFGFFNRAAATECHPTSQDAAEVAFVDVWADAELLCNIQMGCA